MPALHTDQQFAHAVTCSLQSGSYRGPGSAQVSPVRLTPGAAVAQMCFDDGVIFAIKISNIDHVIRRLQANFYLARPAVSSVV